MGNIQKLMTAAAVVVAAAMAGCGGAAAPQSSPSAGFCGPGMTWEKATGPGNNGYGCFRKGGTTTANPAPASPAPATVAPATAASPTVTGTTTRVVFVVTGYAPQGADITYGSDSDSRSPAGGLGFDGSGEAVPWSGSIRYTSSALYYDVSAQLLGGGDIKCKVRVKVTRFLSDGSHVSRSETVAAGHASGGYNICQAESLNN